MTLVVIRLRILRPADMTTLLLLQELNEDRDHYENVASWDTENQDHPPDPFLQLYPEQQWIEYSHQYFLDRIDGPYTILSQVEQDG